MSLYASDDVIAKRRRGISLGEKRAGGGMGEGNGSLRLFRSPRTLARSVARVQHEYTMREAERISSETSQVSRNEALIEKWDNSVYKKYVNFFQILKTWGLTENTKILYTMFVIQVHT